MIALQEMREKRGLTQAELAARSGVSQQAISKIEKGERENPGTMTLLKLSEALRCSIYDLITEEKPGA